MEAMCFYAAMSGAQPNKEVFIRDWCAVKLTREHKRIVTVETTRSEFRQWFFCTEAQRKAYDELPLPQNYRIDMIIYNPRGDDTTKAELRALIEFKTNPNPKKVIDDIKRTAGLLYAVRALPDLSEGPRFGYQIVCVRYQEKSDIEKDFENLGNLSGRHPCFSLDIAPEAFVIDGIWGDEGKETWWGAVFGFKVTGELVT